MDEFETIPDMALVYDEPCSNCLHYSDGVCCTKGHRQKTVIISTGRIAEVVVRKKGGCRDHNIKEGLWWGQEPYYYCSGCYGGSKRSVI